MTTEAALRARILAAVRQKWPRRTGVLLFGRPASAATGAGHPDLSGVVRARPIALEIKKAKAKPTPRQVARIQDLRTVGCYAWIVRSPYEACDAVYWTAKGWTRPLSNEPLDLADWLMGDPAKEPAAEFTLRPENDPAVQAVKRAETPPPVLPEPEPLPALPEQDLQFNMTVEPETWDTPEHQDTAARVLGFEDAEHRRDVEDAAEWRGLRADLRTVGDRVTLVYERVDQFLAVLFGVDQKLNRLLALVEEDPEPEVTLPPEMAAVEVVGNDTNGQDTPKPKRTRTRKPKEFTVVPPSEPEPIPDIPF